jgi:hypothetical protein
MDEMRSSPPESACRQSASEIGSSDDAALAPRSSSGTGKRKQRGPGALRWAKARGLSAVHAVGAMRRVLRVNRTRDADQERSSHRQMPARPAP